MSLLKYPNRTNQRQSPPRTKATLRTGPGAKTSRSRSCRSNELRYADKVMLRSRPEHIGMKSCSTHRETEKRLSAAIVDIDTTDSAVATGAILVEPDSSCVVLDCVVQGRRCSSVNCRADSAVKAVGAWLSNAYWLARRAERRLNHVIRPVDNCTERRLALS